MQVKPLDNKAYASTLKPKENILELLSLKGGLDSENEF